MTNIKGRFFIHCFLEFFKNLKPEGGGGKSFLNHSNPLLHKKLVAGVGIFSVTGSSSRSTFLYVDRSLERDGNMQFASSFTVI